MGWRGPDECYVIYHSAEWGDLCAAGWCTWEVGDWQERHGIRFRMALMKR